MIKSVALFALAALSATALTAPAVSAPQAPHVSVASIDQLPQPLPFPYDENADAQAVVAKAKAQAKREHKRLLIDLGGNWCLDCRVLASIMELPELQPYLAKHFVIAKVNIGRFDKNGEIAAHYGINGRLEGVPAILVVDPAHDRLLNRDKLFALADARHMTPQGLADWLAQWVA
ncbi:thioredoxin family protein [Sphingomonas abietis]|uniref:Thioredoxin family protein n=1 Tax=Sphingomonas abietis TaxID=3012344 RepID=A0ABY7NM90_9SPHN|nr:thioredoxin family protein [Sphingomonas abietis]WBO22473.1 thioredoxin family protein [Sphingomonas abietis]